MKDIDTGYDTTYDKNKRYSICQSGKNYYRVFALCQKISGLMNCERCWRVMDMK